MTNKNKKMLNDDAMANMLLAEPTTKDKKKKGSNKSGGATDTCGCSIF